MGIMARAARTHDLKVPLPPGKTIDATLEDAGIFHIHVLQSRERHNGRNLPDDVVVRLLCRVPVPVKTLRL